MEKTSMRFLFGDRELIVTAGDLRTTPLDVIVIGADRRLRQSNELASKIAQQAGSQLRQESEQLIREHGEIESGMAVYTSAGSLANKAVIHAVLPKLEEENSQRLLEQAISRSLQLCDINDWRSIGLSVFSNGEPDSIMQCAQAYFRAITRFWDARYECPLEKVIIFTQAHEFRCFFDAFRDEGVQAEEGQSTQQQNREDVTSVGHVELSESDIAELDDAEIDKWFK